MLLLFELVPNFWSDPKFKVIRVSQLRQNNRISIYISIKFSEINININIVNIIDYFIYLINVTFNLEYI